MAFKQRYPLELRERATRMAVEPRRDPETRMGASRRAGEQLGVHPEALRTWVKHAETDAGDRPGVPSGEQARISDLEREVRELRRASTILKRASAFFAAGLDRPQR
jgi:transposase